MTNPTCACGCGRPVADGYARHECALRLAESLRAAAGHAEDAWDVIARQARVRTAGGARRLEPEPPPAPEDLRRNPVTAFGWQASVERPLAGALRPEPTPVDLGASDRYAAVGNTMTTWARVIADEQFGSTWVCMDNPVAEAAAWLAGHVDAIRQHPAAREAFGELERACRQLERLVDRHGDNRHLVGVCDCGKILYAPWDWTVIQCKETTCGAVWKLADGQDILLRHLDDKLLTAAETARLAAYLDTDRSQEQIRKLINKWAERGQIGSHGHVLREPTEAELRDDPDAGTVTVPTFRFGEIRDRLAQTPRRTRTAA
jgi:hypothetical protein